MPSDLSLKTSISKKRMLKDACYPDSLSPKILMMEIFSLSLLFGEIADQYLANAGRRC
jgi:hypothetical protein